MSNYPYSIDDDTDIYRVDDNITEISGTNFNQVRDAVFKIEAELGIKPSGTTNSLNEFLNVSHNGDGSIKASALAAVGLVTLPIDNADVGVNAGILESKLTLDFSTSSLKALIEANNTLIVALQVVTGQITTNLNSHIGGGPASNLRHVGSHIDINAVPFDARDPSFVWGGLLNPAGAQRSATTVAEALDQINEELVAHQTTALSAHSAEHISVDTSNFNEIPATANNVQLALEELDASEEKRLGVHRAIMHSAGVPVDSRAEAVKVFSADGTHDTAADGYGENVVPVSGVNTYVATFPGTVPVDNVTTGDDIISFKTPADAAATYILDSQFSQVKPGDIVRVNYGDGYGDGYGGQVEHLFAVESIRFIPGSEWVIRINGNNIVDAPENATARIDRPLWDPNIQNVMVAAAANLTPDGVVPAGFFGSLTIADPRSAIALGITFDAGHIDETHYKLYLQLYPTGNPTDKVINLPAIDVSGNAGTTPGDYTLDSVVEATNNSLRRAGYNYRFLAFQHNGNFGISMADAINGAAFSIVSGNNSTGSLLESTYTENVVGDAVDGFDALGFGSQNAAVASPAYQGSFVDSTAALLPTKIHMPRRKSYVVNGTRKEFVRSATGALDGYYDATISSRVQNGTTVKVSYCVKERLDTIGLKRGKTITVQPAVDFSNSSYNDVDYGRFMIDDVVFIPTCPGDPDQTIITVANGIHGYGSAITASSVDIPVRLYMGSDSVTFNLDNVIDSSPSGIDYHRLHEVYATDEGKTFSHERGRIPIQSAVGLNLGTENWHISNISPKFRGEIDASTTSFKRFIRFYVLSYNATSGEFDGYIGTPEFGGDSIFETGPIVTGRKDIPTRFYDKTGTDFIDLNFIETSAIGVGTNIPVPAYVDIEIFPTLALDDEFLRLATAEINWQPSTGQNIVERVIDRRSIGSTSELEFTQSAKDFIQAGEKYLHENGVIRGLEFEAADPSDNGVLTFKGGLALVNGAFVNVNNGNVKIPEITDNDGISTLDWAVCVNTKGKFETIPLTASKKQFFGLRSGNPTPFYIPSVTFSELVNDRKDLTPIYIANVTISSVVVNSVSDARRYPVPSRALGNFDTFEQALTWGRYTPNTVVSVKENVTIESEVDLTTASNLTICGDGGIITVESQIGFRVLSNVTFKDLDIIYNGSFSSLSASPNITHYDQLSGCIYIDAATSSNDITIQGCNFSRTINEARAPFIQADFNGARFDRIVIDNNTFTPGAADTYNSAIGLFYTGTGASETDVTNLRISNNKVYGNNSIIFTSKNPAGKEMDLNNVAIEGNYCRLGMIGYYTNSILNLGDDYSKEGILRIRNNIVALIARVDKNGTSSAIGDGTSTGFVEISNNQCHYIYTFSFDTGNVSGITIRDNTLFSDVFANYSNWSLANNDAIYITGGSGNFNSKIIIENNRIETISSSQRYTNAIQISGAADHEIRNNIINGCFTTYGILTSTGSKCVIKDNDIRRNNLTITAYISCSVSPENLIIKDNILDDRTVNGVSEITIIAPLSAYIERNINHIKEETLSSAIYGKPQPLFRSFSDTSPAHIGAVSVNQYDSLIYNYTVGGSGTCGLLIGLRDILPPHAKITSFSLDISVDDGSDWTSSSITARLFKSGNSNVYDSVIVDPTNSGTAGPQSVNVLLPNTLATDWLVGSYDRIEFQIDADHSAGQTTLTFTPFTIKYTY